MITPSIEKDNGTAPVSSEEEGIMVGGEAGGQTVTTNLISGTPVKDTARGPTRTTIRGGAKGRGRAVG